MVKKILLFVLVLVFTATGVFAATSSAKPKSPIKTKIIEVQTKDNFVIKAKLLYPKGKQKNFPTIIMLHSLGYSSSSWGSLPETLAKQGYGVIAIDLRGHGLSNKDIKFRMKSWMYMSNKSFAKYPYDVLAVVNYVKQTSKKFSFNNYAIIGGDIGANTGVIYAQMINPKPHAMVLLTPYQNLKGLNIYDYRLGTTPLLVMCCKRDKYAVCQEVMLKTFSKGQFIINNTNLTTNGMLILKQDAQCRAKAIQFINQKLPPQKIVIQHQ